MSMIGLGGLAARRPDQQYRPGQGGNQPGSRSGIFKGRLVVIFGSGPNIGLFVYSPTVGAGKLIASIAASAGTDPYGNAYRQGITSYGGTPLGSILINMNADVLQFGPDNPALAGSLFGAAGILHLQSPGTTLTDVACQVDLHSSQETVTGIPTVEVLESLSIGGSVYFLSPSGDATGAADTVAINSAASQVGTGGLVQLLAGTYNVSAPLTPGGAVLQGAGAVDPFDFGQTGTVIAPVAAFAGGTAVIAQTATGATTVKGFELRHLTIDGTAAPAAIDLVSISGNIDSPVLDDVILSRATGKGLRVFSAGGHNPLTGRYNRVRARQCADAGIAVDAHTDATWYDCAARGCGGTTIDGFTISFAANSTFTACRAEFNGRNGFNLTGAGGYTMINPATDRNAQSGIAVTGAGPFSSTAPITIIGPRCRRDASSGTGSGIAIVGSPGPVVVSAPAIFSGVDDGGTGLNSPANGITVQNTVYAAIRGPGYVQAATRAFNILGGNTYLDLDQASIVTATGVNTASPGSAGAPAFAQVFTAMTNANLANGWTITGSLRYRTVGRYLEMDVQNVISPAVAQADASNIINAGVLPAWLAPAQSVRAEILGLAVPGLAWSFEITGAVTCYGFSALTNKRVDGVLRIPLD